MGWLGCCCWGGENDEGEEGEEDGDADGWVSSLLLLSLLTAE